VSMQARARTDRRLRLLGSFKGAHNCLFHYRAHLLETFTQVGGNARNVPAQAKRYVSDGGTAHLEAYCRCYTIRVRYKSFDVDSEIVCWIRVGTDAYQPKNISDMTIPQKIVAKLSPISSNWLVRGNTKERCSMEDADCSVHGIQDGVLGRWKFSSRKVLGTFVISKTDMYHIDLFLAMLSE
jgi:hypothetical protein